MLTRSLTHGAAWALVVTACNQGQATDTAATEATTSTSTSTSTSSTDTTGDSSTGDSDSGPVGTTGEVACGLVEQACAAVEVYGAYDDCGVVDPWNDLAPAWIGLRTELLRDIWGADASNIWILSSTGTIYKKG